MKFEKIETLVQELRNCLIDTKSITEEENNSSNTLEGITKLLEDDKVLQMKVIQNLFKKYDNSVDIYPFLDKNIKILKMIEEYKWSYEYFKHCSDVWNVIVKYKMDYPNHIIIPRIGTKQSINENSYCLGCIIGVSECQVCFIDHSMVDRSSPNDYILSCLHRQHVDPNSTEALDIINDLSWVDALILDIILDF